MAPSLAETPYLSGTILLITAGTGYIYTTFDEDDDTGRASTAEENADDSVGSSPTDRDGPNEPEDRRTDPSQSVSERVESTSDADSGDDSTESTADSGEESFDFEFDWQHQSNVSMGDVGGMDEVKRQLHQVIVRPLRTDRERADALDISAPNVLLYAPPGTGKTFLARALATELQLPFVSLSGSDVTSKWINESAQRVDRLFTEAKALSASEGGALIFLDEVDAVLPQRSGDTHEESRKVVNEFLAQLQDTDEHDIVFIAATNRRDQLDKAATRNGRIDHEIEIGLPDLEGRLGILQAQLESRRHALSEEHLLELADRTVGCSAADLQSLVEDAARNAAFERNDDRIIAEDFQHLW